MTRHHNQRRRFEHWLRQRTNRRQFLAGTAALTATLSLRGQPTRLVSANTNLVSVGNPFALGVASGDPLPDGVVLWTRLAPQPLDGGGMPKEAVSVNWQGAGEEEM